MKAIDIANTTCLKKALKRENDGTPIGKPGNMYLDCACGYHLPMLEREKNTTCVCGTVYTAGGWLVK